MKHTNTTQVVILAAGQGKRMGAEKPKVLREVSGKPMLARLFESVIVSGVTEKPIVVVSPANELAIREALGDRCFYARQQEQRGTGDALAAAKSVAEGAERILVLYGDHPFLREATIAVLDRLHRESGDVLAMMTVRVPDFQEWRSVFFDFGRMVRDEKGNIAGIREKKDASESELQILEVNPGLYIFESKWLWKHLGKLDNKNAQGEYYLTDLIKMAVDEGRAIASVEIPPEEALGINTPEQLEIAEKLFSGGAL